MKGANSNDHSEKHSAMYRNQLLTIGDLEDCKKPLFDEIRNLLKETNGQHAKKWLRSPEVRKILGISPGTLQNLRVNRMLAFSKVGGVVFQRYDDIISLLGTNSNPKTR